MPKARVKNGEFGYLFETLVKKFFKAFNITLKRMDKHNVRNPDFMLEIPFDAKVRFQPLYGAMNMVGIEPEKCVSLDFEKIHFYLQTKRNVFLLWYIDYTPDFDTKGLYIISTEKLRKIMKDPERVTNFYDSDKLKTSKRVNFSIDECFDASDFVDLGIIHSFLFAKNKEDAS